MKKTLSFFNLMIVSILFISFTQSCNKDLSSMSPAAVSSTNGSATSSTIAVALDSLSNDSVYIIQPCARGYFRDSIAASALPGNISPFVATNYNGYVLLQAYVIKDSAGTIGGYVTIIDFNNKPVGLLFNSNGGFEGVLEQRQPGDINGVGWHHGGRFENRDGHGKDTVSLSALPASILTYFSGNYPQDTLLKAYINIDSSFLVISENNGLFATVFSSTGDFVRRVQLHTPGPVVQQVDQTTLPSAAQSYLSTTYPDYVIEKVFSFTSHASLQGYIAVIDANNTKYAVQFDASGNFIGAITIW
jgi:hypothetical protein